MTARYSAVARAAAVTPVDLEASDEACAMYRLHSIRARFWRVALGALGLFWVCVLLALLG